MGVILKQFIRLLSKLFGQFWRLVNLNGSSVLIFTDSRGFEVTSWHNRYAPWNSYIGMLSKSYRVTYVIQPEKHTTIYDFLYYSSDRDLSSFDKIVLHCGVVDFSSRPESDYKLVSDSKKDKIKHLFGEQYWDSLMTRELRKSHLYNGEKTLSLVDLELSLPIFSKLSELNNLLWIPSNRVLLNWRGNYWRDRPTDINMVWSNSKSLLDVFDLAHVDILKWTDNEIRLYTVDNIHFSRAGMEFLFKQISKSIDEN